MALLFRNYITSLISFIAISKVNRRLSVLGNNVEKSEGNEKGKEFTTLGPTWTAVQGPPNDPHNGPPIKWGGHEGGHLLEGGHSEFCFPRLHFGPPFDFLLQGNLFTLGGFSSIPATTFNAF